VAGVPASSRGSSGGFSLLNYTEFTSPVTVSGTSEGTATTLVTASAAVTVAAATLICVEFYAPNVIPAATTAIWCDLFQDATALGLIASLQSPATTIFSSLFARRYLTPGAGSFTYAVKAYRGTANGTVNAGSGGAAAWPPGYIRVTSGD
jgi:hypothetical protein